MDTRYSTVPLSGVRDKNDSFVNRNVYVDLSSASSDQEDMDEDDFEEENAVDMRQRLRENLLLASDEENVEGSDSSGSDGDDGQDRRSVKMDRWGRDKSTFYQEGESEDSSSDQRLHEEEAMLLQQKTIRMMDDADYDLPTSVGLTMAAEKHGGKKQKKAKRHQADEDVERIVSKKDKGDKELKALLSELEGKAGEVTEMLTPILDKARAGEIQTSSGLSFLELKNVLLLNYCMNLNFYLLLKAEGKAVKDHPVIDELVRLRLLIEKTKPIDDKIRPQVNRLLKTAVQGVESVMSDPSMMRADPSSMLMGKTAAGRSGASSSRAPKLRIAGNGDDGGDGDDDAGVYQAPRSTAMFFDEDEARAEKRARRAKRDKGRAARSEIMKMVREEFADGPEEQSTGLGVMEVNEEAHEVQRQRDEYEEDNFVRLTVSKASKKALRPEYADDLRSLDDFGDMERAIKSSRMAQEDEGGQVEGPLSRMAKKLREAQEQQFQVAAEAADSRIVSKRDLEAEAAYDEFLEEAQKKREEAKRSKYSTNPNARRQVKQVAFSEDGKRSITKQIEQNRGIAHQKKKDIARVRNRKKFVKAEQKLSSMTRKVRKEDKRYEGESAGINANVVRSTKLR